MKAIVSHNHRVSQPLPYFFRPRSVSPRPVCKSSRTLATAKQAWVQTSSKDVFTAAVESGFSTVLFPASKRSECEDWKQIASFKPLFLVNDAIEDETGLQIGSVTKIRDGEELKALQSQAKNLSGVAVMDASDWKIIPAENLVATFQSLSCDLFAVARTFLDARVMFEALEVGMDGVLLRTEDPLEVCSPRVIEKKVRNLGVYLAKAEQESGECLKYETGCVTQVQPLGMGHRICVDLCENLHPGEGMLVGSFSRGLFLVHSECMESNYINSRPFRVNAGSVHSYIQGMDNRTAYLSELRSGSSVLVVNSNGSFRRSVVGRVKQENRPMTMIEAELPNGDKVSTILQNAETVRLVGPPMDETLQTWETHSVSNIHPGALLYVLSQGGARHTGIVINEHIEEF